MSEPKKSSLRFPVIVFSQQDTVNPVTGLHDYRGFLTVQIPGKGDCLPIFESRNAAELFFSEQRPGPGQAIHLRKPEDVSRLLVSVLQDGVQWVAVEPLGDLSRTRYHRIADLLAELRQA